MSEREQCKRCGVKYPIGLVMQMFVNGAYTSVCGICALKISNELHGDNRRRFTGTQAERLRQDALAWRKKHPQLAS